MLHITFNEPVDKNFIPRSSTLFDAVYSEDWFNDEVIKQMVKDIDNSVVQSAFSIISPVLGSISCERLSGGVKSLIMLLKYERPSKEQLIFQSSSFGDNCFSWLFAIAKEKDIYLYINSFFPVPKKHDNYYHVDMETYSVYCLDDQQSYTGYMAIRDLFIDGRAGALNDI